MSEVGPIRSLTSAQQAAEVLRAGGLVGLPTETVYGLAADARNPAAIRRVFAAKARPRDHPLIVHVAAASDIADWAVNVDPQLRALAARTWPGPLTIVVPRARWVPDDITGGLDTVALRVPGQPLAVEVIRRLGGLTAGPAGVVAPSANVFGAVSPTTAAHVREGLAGRLQPGDGVLDGGPCAVGVESTIVVAVSGRLQVLRPGAVVLSEEPEPARIAAPGIRAPGMLAAHYAPRARVLVAADAGAAAALPVTGPVGLLAPADMRTPEGWHRLAAPADDHAYAAALYAALRAADAADLATVVAVAPATGLLRGAILDRLSRAAVGSAATAPGRDLDPQR